MRRVIIGLRRTIASAAARTGRTLPVGFGELYGDVFCWRQAADATFTFLLHLKHNNKILPENTFVDSNLKTHKNLTFLQKNKMS
ncbi:hypothetical protein [Collimonas fungivorans]|uniref:hypothetical protein n=1 Tax=Collimonas fungivorans TaxID=158899 RepID=UPI0026EB942B|nr:hypothetical protein [Collimonas fungivorans]